jgi:serine/threonine-protein kinase
VEARDQTLGRRVAVKIILPNLSRNAFPRALPVRGALGGGAGARERAAHHDFGDAEGEPPGWCLLLENRHAGRRLERGAVTPAQAIEWIRQLASALDAAHAAGVLHRDVKPAT